MDLNQLRYFVTTAQLENVSKAAQALFLRQPSLSKSIRKLEEEIGTPLFDRRGRKLTLNAQGERFLESTNRILQELESAEQEIRQMKGGEGARVRIGIAGCESRMIACVAAFRAGHPGVRFDLDFGIESEEEPDISAYDVLVCPETAKYGKFAGERLGEERYLFAVPAKDPAAALPFISTSQLKNRDYVFIRTGKRFGEYPYRVCRALNIPYRSVCFTDAPHTQRMIISSGMACGFAAEGQRDAYDRDPGIRLIPVENKKFTRTMKICFKKEKHLTAPALEFRDAALAFLFREREAGDAEGAPAAGGRVDGTV